MITLSESVIEMHDLPAEFCILTDHHAVAFILQLPNQFVKFSEEIFLRRVVLLQLLKLRNILKVFKSTVSCVAQYNNLRHFCSYQIC